MSKYTELENAAWSIAAALERIVGLLEAFAATDSAAERARHERMEATKKAIVELYENLSAHYPNISPQTEPEA